MNIDDATMVLAGLIGLVSLVKIVKKMVSRQQKPQRHQKPFGTTFWQNLLLLTTTLVTKVVNIFAKYGDIMVDEKMLQDGTFTPDEGEKPWKKGLITFGSFLVFGSAPILAFIILIPFTRNDTHKFIGACIFSALALAAIGIAKAKITGQIYVLSAGGTLLNGAIAGFAAYAVGWILRDVAGLED
ncbi:membrane protein of ER body-like protein [Tanacetum coccineum]